MANDSSLFSCEWNITIWALFIISYNMIILGWTVVNFPLLLRGVQSHSYVPIPHDSGGSRLVRLHTDSGQLPFPGPSPGGTMWWVSLKHPHTHTPPFASYLLFLWCPVSPLCVVLFFTLSRKKPPHWVMQIVLMVGAFVMSIAWLNVIANEVVSVLQSLGLLVGISTGLYRKYHS